MADIFDATIHDGVAAGSCVVIADHAMIYAGPIDGMPDAGGKVVLLSADDFAAFADHMKREQRH